MYTQKKQKQDESNTEQFIENWSTSSLRNAAVPGYVPNCPVCVVRFIPKGAAYEVPQGVWRKGREWRVPQAVVARSPHNQARREQRALIYGSLSGAELCGSDLCGGLQNVGGTRWLIWQRYEVVERSRGSPSALPQLCVTLGFDPYPLG